MLLIRIAGQHNARGKIFTAGNQSVQGGAIRGRQCA
jgi:predicted outer membrane repeat protein